MTASVTVRVPAKVNLSLEVGPPQPDGYHQLATVFHAVSLFDEVTATDATLADVDAEVTVTVEGPGARDVPLDGDNLAVRAAELLSEYADSRRPVRLHIRKGIPVAGGMAGGSADAAGALVACEALWQTGIGRRRLLELAAELGSDVPFAMLGGTAIGSGRGDRLTPALARGDYHWVVALADRGLSTPLVYKELDRLRSGRVLPEPRVPDAMMQALRRGDAETVGALLSNDLQNAAVSLHPDLERTLAVGSEYGALGGIVSGSGPTVVFLARDTEHALDLSVALTASGAAADVRRARGPVHGARVVETGRLA
ncbi:MAG TPA: 4-(cytidine 5'-diphospho)-2-C-methyl-D-erythritol kinase [Kineosporiaceae bacterium]|jgi:4-diphosphocytidyl-2-C-methyl-D-erythritol kinase|nr:4-(cytidine 5'-diphospho)-2-C-methyl-D-erythritol kinase [Kineosporiaceae bacterium]